MSLQFVTTDRPLDAFRPLRWPSAHSALAAGRAAVRTLGNNMAAALPCCLALAGVGLCTWASFRLGQSFAFTGFLYLALVVLTARHGSFLQATLVSVVAATCLNYFFVPPIFSFANSPANWVALGAFEFTAVVISRLSQRAQLRAQEAIADRRDMERLYETSRRILLMDTSQEPGNRIPALIRDIFNLQAVLLFDAPSAATYQSGQSPPAAGQNTRDAYFQDANIYSPETKSWFCVIRFGVRPVGGMGLIGTAMTKLAATALASLAGIAIERARTQQREFRSQAARQTEQLRTAVLDALAHEFKTPLAVARTASSGLLALGGLSELQTELVATIDQQANKLDQLASRLLRSAMLDSSECKPRQESTLLSRLARVAMNRVEPLSERERFRISGLEQETPVLADPQLILTAIAQFVDNAVKYSEPGSPVDVRIVSRTSEVVLTVRSKGIVISPAERERVFDRFYRAPEAQHLPAGTGLGLSIVKKIMEAHRGSAWAEGEPGYGTSFSLALPAAHAKAS